MNTYFSMAKDLADESTSARQVGAVIVKDNVLISAGSNDHWEPCKREGFPTGVGYDICDGCNYDNHAEANALRGVNAKGADLYLYGHYYVCPECQKRCDEAGIENIYIWEE